MDNFQRGDKAAQALDAIGYEPVGGTVGIKIPTPDGGETTGPEGYPISDLIADLAHLAQRNGLDIMHLVDQGIQHYGADVIEQAWEHDDTGWMDTLQHPLNKDRAIMVLRAAGVPDRYDEDIFVKVGIIHPDDRSDD